MMVKFKVSLVIEIENPEIDDTMRYVDLHVL